MLAAKPIGPRNKSSKPILTLPLSTSTPQAPETQTQSLEETNFTLSDQLSTATTSHFTPMVPRLNIPRRPLKPGLGPLQINVSVYDRERTEERTIQPEQTLSPERIHQRPRQQGVSSRKSSGDLPLVLPPLPRRDSLHDLRDALNQVANASHPVTGSGNSSFSTSPKSTTNTSPEVDGNNDNQAQTSSSRSLEFSDEYLEVLSRLGEGAGGAVHKVRDTRDGAIYARKTITTREVAMRQVVRELNIISTTSHVNIVQCFGAYMTPSSSEVKIVMEHCEAGSLEAVGMKIKEANAVVGEKIAGRIAEGVLQGLAYLHSKRTIHRDIKPSNILLSRDGVVKLSDFGVSGELVNSMVGTFTGTLLYMAPERVTGSEYSVRSDVWSTGISILELVQNRFPFPSDVPTIELIVTITKGEPPQLEDDPDAGIFWGDKMKDFIRQTLICDPQKRPTPREMLSHPWITDVMAQEDHMARWIRQVWGWPKPRKNTGLKDTMDQSEKSI